MAKTGIVYGSSSGNTQAAAMKIKALIGEADVMSISDVTLDDMAQYDHLILGSSTWGNGEVQDDWAPVLDRLSKLDLRGKTVAFFGTGDQSGFPDTFVDAIGILADAIKQTQARLVGAWPTDGYTFDDSRAVVDGQFVGLALDEGNQADLTEARIRAWVAQITPELG